ncbi:MAG: PIN domain-containing protein [Ilumatobacteraceae bacterium]
MIVLDAYAVIAMLSGESAAAEVVEIMRGDEPTMLTPLGVAEILDRMVRLADADPDDIVLDVAALDLLDAEPLSAAVAMRAGLLRARRYHRTRCAVSLADCVVVEVVREHDASVCTSDPHLLDVCQHEGISAIPLPDATAGSPSPDRHASSR